MSESIDNCNSRNNYRWQLLTTVSALTLIGNVYATRQAKADEDADRPVFWVELGGQLEQQTGQGDPYLPSFVVNNPDSPAYKPISPFDVVKAPLFSNGGDAKLTFEPSHTDWVFSASVRYGRSTGPRNFTQTKKASHVNHYTVFPYYTPGCPGGYHCARPKMVTRTRTITEFARAQIKQSQSHTVVDFAAGKDVGLGMFGKGGTSDFSVGVRFAQFAAKASGSIEARPDAKFVSWCPTYIYYTLVSRFPGAKFCHAGQGHHDYFASFQNQRNFHGVGPTVSWNASLPVVGEEPGGRLNVDWGANVALLFGRQRASGNHHTSSYYHISRMPPSVHATQHTGMGGFNRSRALVVPNVGGFAGVSFNFTNVKVSVGYRGDFFFGAMDGGIDARKTETVGFYGPFASVSIGLGG
ncbi:MAG TPA: hypothetical protein VIJ62_06170 [Rhizomicrobium sp.]